MSAEHGRKHEVLKATYQAVEGFKTARQERERQLIQAARFRDIANDLLRAHTELADYPAISIDKYSFETSTVLIEDTQVGEVHATVGGSYRRSPVGMHPEALRLTLMSEAGIEVIRINVDPRTGNIDEKDLPNGKVLKRARKVMEKMDDILMQAD